LEWSYQYRPALFFLLAYALTWTLWFVGIYVGSRPGLEAYGSVFSLVGLLGPIGTALHLVFTSGSEALKSDFKDRLFNLRRIRPIFVLAAIAMPFAVILLSILLSVAFGQPTDQFKLSGGGNLLAMIILAMVLAPIMEEVGWHGYGVDSLRAKTGMLQATLLFGVLWSVWHAPLFLIGGTYQNTLAGMDNPVFVANFFVSVIPAAIIANWFYYRNSRSIALAVFLHAMLNAASVLLNAGQIAKCIATLLYAAIAATLMVADRALFAEGQRNFLGGDARQQRKDVKARGEG
jgi:membrane protease YdiL (CAAX protease family)